MNNAMYYTSNSAALKFKKSIKLSSLNMLPTLPKQYDDSSFPKKVAKRTLTALEIRFFGQSGPK